MKHRAICFITALALCLSLCPVRVLAAGGAERPSTDFKVTDNWTVTRTYEIKEPLLFDTCGHSYTVSGQTALRVWSGGRLYLTSGGIRSTGGAGIEVLAGGFLCVDEAGMTVAGTTYGLDIAPGAEVQLSGGTFTGNESAIRAQDGDYIALLASAGGTYYAYFDKNDSPISLFDANGNRAAPSEMAGKTTVTVKECTDHAYICPANPRVPTHNVVCRYCGETVEAVFCTFSFDASGHAVCQDGCGHTLDITVSPAEEEYDGTDKPSDAVTVTVELDRGTDNSTQPDYTVTCEPLASAGETLITVTGEKWSYQMTFRVTRATPGITWAETSGAVDYDGEPVDRTELPAVTVTAANERDEADLEQCLYFSYREKDSGDGFTQGLPTDAGTYTVIASLPETANYHGASSAELTLTINKIDPVKEAPKALELTYNGAAQKLVTPGAVWDGAVILFAASQDGPWSRDIPTGTNAGFYEAWYTVEETKNYNNVVGTIFPDIEIRRKPVTPVVVLEHTSYVYTGGEIQPTVTVRDPEDWKELPGTEYEVTYWNNQDVGTAQVIVSDKAGGNYAITPPEATQPEVTPPEGQSVPEGVVVEFEITPAEQAGLTVTDRPNEVAYGDVFTLGTSGGSGDGAVTWEIVSADPAGTGVTDNGTHSVSAIARIDKRSGQVTVTGVGTVTVRATKSEGGSGSGNHKDAAAEWTFTAYPKRVTAVVTAAGKTYDGEDTTTVSAVILEQDIVPGDKIEISGLSGKFRDGAGAGTGKIVDVTGGAVITVNGETINNGGMDEKYIVTIPGTAVADIRKAEAAVTVPTSKEPTYSGEAQELVNAASATPSDLAVEYALSANGRWSTDVPTGTDAGRYEVWYRVRESANYTGVPAAMVEVTIQPKTVTPDITVTPGSIEYDGTEKKPAVTVKDSDNGREIPASEYTVTYSNNINVGSATVTITDRAGGNYTVNGTASFTITSGGKATLTGTPLAKDLTYNGREQELVTVGTADGGHLEYALAKEASDGSMTGGQPEDGDYGAAVPKGMQAGLYKVYYRIVGDGNHTGTEPAWVFVTIEPKTVSSPVITLTLPEGGFTYDGRAKTFDEDAGEITVKDGGDVIPSSEYTVSYSNNVNAGTATVRITDNNGGNYTVNGSAVFVIGEATAGFITAPAARTLTYNGGAQTLITAGIPDGGTALYWLEGGTPSTGLPTGTGAGAYRVYYQVRGDGNHADSTQGSLDVTIGRKPVADPAVELSSNRFRYNGSEQKPAVTVRDGDGHVIAADEYTVTYAGADPTSPEASAGDAPPANTVDVGSYYVVVTSKGINYGEFQKAVKVEITPAEQAGLEITGKPDAVRYGDTIRLGTTGGTGNGAVEWSVEPGGTGNAEAGEIAGQFTITKAGSITIKATRKSATGNYANAEDTWTFTADPAPLSLDGVTVTPKAGLTYDRTEQALIEIVVDGTVTGGELVCFVNGGDYGPGAPKGTNAREYTVSYKVRATDGNHTDSAVKTVTVTIGKAKPEIVELPKGTPITTEQEVQESRLEGGRAAFKGKDVEGEFTWLDGEGIWILTPGTCYASAKFTPTGDDADNFESVEGFEAEFEVTEAPKTGGSSSTGGGSGSGGVIIDEDDDDIENLKPGAESASVRTSVQDGAASTVVNGAAGDELVDEAVANESKAVVIRPEIDGDVTKTEVSIPASAVGRLGSETDAALTVSTPVADVTIPNGALEALSGAGGTVGVAAERVENTVVLTLTADGRKLEDIPGGLTLTVSAKDPGPGTVAVILYEDGTRETIRRSVAEGGAVRIPLSGSATVEIVDDNSREFADVSPDSWASDAVAFTSAHELFNGTGKTTFSPELTMSRGMLAVVLHNLESNPETAFNDIFADVGSGAWYAEAVSWAADRGIATGYDNGSFGAADPITREQLAVMLWRYAGSPAADSELNFTDAGNTSSWALEAMSWAVENGIINGFGNGILSPGGQATRAQAAQMMKNFMENT